MKNQGILYFFVCLLFLVNLPSVNAQITAPGASASVVTQYTVFPEADNIYIFCTQNQETAAGSLQVQTALAGTKTFLWEKYNSATAGFEFYQSESTDEQQSVISGLEDGGYRVTITQGETVQVYRAWVFNNWITASAAITDSNCESFTLEGNFTAAPMVYNDLANNAELEVFKDIQIEWLTDQAIVSGLLITDITNPPTRNTEYTLRVYDRFGCETTASVLYESIAVRARFTAEPMQGEAPLTVTFNNLSENADPNQYEWFFYRNLDDIKREAETTQQPIDSIMTIAYDQNPVFTYENSGTYKVKLVAKKTTEFQTCTDTAYLDGFIVVDTSFVAVPNVFTPNGDGTNDLFIVKFWSMQSIKISIFNRWGKRIHFWENNNIRGFEETYTATVWDGRLGNRFASPGVYYYIVEGRGRDNKIRKAHGFFHLFRGND
jgi:gliding motility-associated-like protein